MASSPWTDPQLTARNRLPMHAIRHPDRLDLDGTWLFQLLPAPDAKPTPAWIPAPVPSCWTMQDVGDAPRYTNVIMPFSALPPNVPDRNPTGVYERTFEVPERWAGRRIVLHVGGAESALFVELNGREIGISKDLHLAAEFDITADLRPGANTVRLHVVKWSDASYLEDQDQWWHGGITRPVFLYATQRVYLADVRVIALLADDLTTGTLDVHVDVASGDDPPEAGWTVEAYLGGLAGTLRGTVPTPVPGGPQPIARIERALITPAVDEPAAGELSQSPEWPSIPPGVLPAPGGHVSLHAELSNVAPWSAEIPRLYPLTVVLRSPSGETVEEEQLHVGFRRIEIEGVHLRINARSVLLRGVN